MQNEYKIVNDIAKIKLTRWSGKEVWSIIDLEDLERVRYSGLNWHVKYVNESYYAMTNCDKEEYGKTVEYLHRFIANADVGDVIDHINHNTLDNRKANLRYSNMAKNAMNRRGKNTNNTSGYRNVSWSKSYKQWVVQLQVEGKNTLIGRFDDVHEAGNFAKRMRLKHYGSYAGKC